MRYCSNCGTQNDSDAKFCSGCGTKLEDVMGAPAEKAAVDTFTDDVVMDEIPPVAPAPDFQQAPPQDFGQPQFQQAPPQQQFQGQYQQPYGQQPYGQQAPQGFVPYQNRVEPAAPISAKCRTFGIISFVLGICSIVFCWIGVIPIVGIGLGFLAVAFGVVGLIFSGISRREGHFTLAKLGKIFSIIGLCLSGILWIVGIIISATGGYYIYY